MKFTQLHSLIKEELVKILNEEYQDKFKMIGTLITNIKQRPQKEIFSDIRSIPGVTVASSKEFQRFRFSPSLCFSGQYWARTSDPYLVEVVL